MHTAQHRQEAMGIVCDVIRVEIEEGLSKDDLLATFINCGRTFITTARFINIIPVTLLASDCWCVKSNLGTVL